MSDSETTELSPEAVLALNEFYFEQDQKLRLEVIKNNDFLDIQFTENWQLSQFWYNERTVISLTEEIIRACNKSGKIALISCPSLYKLVKKQALNHEVKLFEYDKRFEVFGEDFQFYDYKTPLNIPREFSNYFDLVVADPPFLSEECIIKTAITIKFLTNSKIILCTGAVMEELVKKLLNVKKSDFFPEHQNNLANEFYCFTNYDSFVK